MKRKLKRLLRLRNSSGFTLVEVIIACALLGILIIGIMGFITPVLDSVREKEKNARAYMLSDAVSNYIAQSTQYAYSVATFSNASTFDTKGNATKLNDAKYTGTEFGKRKDDGLSKLQTVLNDMNKNPNTPNNFEIKCIGVRWRDDQLTGKKKLMLTNETVVTVNGNLSLKDDGKLVFEECFYNDLYMKVSFENYLNWYEVKKEDGTTEERGDKEDTAPGVKLTVDVYTSPDCYNVDSSVREKAIIAMKGESYIGFNNIRNPRVNQTGCNYTVVPNLDVNTYDGARSSDNVHVYTDSGNSYYYPETFIFYIGSKIRI